MTAKKTVAKKKAPEPKPVPSETFDVGALWIVPVEDEDQARLSVVRPDGTEATVAVVGGRAIHALDQAGLYLTKVDGSDLCVEAV